MLVISCYMLLLTTRGFGMLVIRAREENTRKNQWKIFVLGALCAFGIVFFTHWACFDICCFRNLGEPQSSQSRRCRAEISAGDFNTQISFAVWLNQGRQDAKGFCKHCEHFLNGLRAKIIRICGSQGFEIGHPSGPCSCRIFFIAEVSAAGFMQPLPAGKLT